MPTAASVPHAPLSNPVPPRLSPTYPQFVKDEYYSLALCLCEEEGHDLATAYTLAHRDLDVLFAQGESWDRDAFAAGNDDAMPF